MDYFQMKAAMAANRPLKAAKVSVSIQTSPRHVPMGPSRALPLLGGPPVPQQIGPIVVRQSEPVVLRQPGLVVPPPPIFPAPRPSAKKVVHQVGCSIRNYAEQKLALCKNSEIYESLMLHFMTRKSWNNCKAVADAQRKCEEAMAKDGVIMDYLRSQREMFERVEREELQNYQCQCPEEEEEEENITSTVNINNGQ